MWYTIGMKRLVSAVLVMALVVSSQGCATVKNTRIPKAFSDVGVCKHCRDTVALDGLADDEDVICPECGAHLKASESELGDVSWSGVQPGENPSAEIPAERRRGDTWVRDQGGYRSRKEVR